MSTVKSNWLSRRPAARHRVLSTVQAFREFGLYREQIYAAVERGEVHAVAMPARDPRRSDEGQTRYPEWELSKLAERLALTKPHRESSTVKFRYHPRVRKALAIAA